MREKDLLRKSIESSIILLAGLGLTAIAFCSFPKEIRKQVRAEQNNQCADCGVKVKKLEVHHIVPESKGGSQTRDNAIGLCHECHIIWDSRAGVQPQGSIKVKK